MPTAANPKILATSDNTLTVVSIAALAFVIADLAHEGVGHGFGFYFAGGHSCMLTTTRLIAWIKLPDPQWRMFDFGGPVGNLLIAMLSGLGLRFLRQRPVHLRFFLWLVMAFSLFWAFGYMIFCGVTGRGDWMALIEGTRFLVFGRIAFVLFGLLLYRTSIRLLTRELRRIWPADDAAASSRVSRLLRISYVSGGVIACAGAALDPWGPVEILRSGALSSFGAAVGLLLIARIFSASTENQDLAPLPVYRHLAWILFATAACLYYIAILGPGILMYLGN